MVIKDYRASKITGSLVRGGGQARPAVAAKDNVHGLKLEPGNVEIETALVKANAAFNFASNVAPSTPWGPTDLGSVRL